MAVDRPSFVGRVPRSSAWLFYPRIYRDNGAWECSIVPTGRLRFAASAIGRGNTPAEAYEDWARRSPNDVHRHTSPMTRALQMIKEDDGDLVPGVVRVGPGRVVE